MRNKKTSKTPFRVFENEEDWNGEVEMIVDMVMDKLSDKLENIAANSRPGLNGGYGGQEIAAADRRDDSNSNFGGANPAAPVDNSRFYAIRRQAEEFSGKNPKFNMQEEMKNKNFCYLVFKLGIGVEDAYFLIHKDELLAGNQAGERIIENGAYKNQGVSTKLNPERFSEEDVAKILDRIQDGEQISF